AYESLLRFLALVVISDYLRGIVEDPAIDSRLKKLFSSKISPGQWVENLREILKIYSGSSEKIYMPEILDFYMSGRKQSAQGKKFESWVQRRNKFRSHALSLNTQESITKTWEQWWPEFKKLMEQLSFLTHYEMIIPAFIQRGTITKAQICSGPDQFFIFKDEYDLPLTIKGVEPNESLLLVDKRNRSRQLLLYPFMVFRMPADFYLFERGERKKGDLHQVVFAKLGPGDALVIRRADREKGILEDIEKRLQRFGEIGISIDGYNVDDPVESPEEKLFQEAEKIADKWSKAGYPYHMVEGLSETLRALVRHPPENAALPEGTAFYFLLTASFHYGGNWCFWVQQSRNNPVTLEHLFRILGISYSRPRLRVLYALQLIPEKSLKEYYEKSKTKLSSDVQTIIEKYVLFCKVSDYLTRLKQEANPDLSKKASGVIQEARQYCGLKIWDDKKSGDLPLI
ncbi:hypothetical protein QUF70_16355, partial [Desulfobacterales bacterium HSG17]|nr:hypothetical protein [Desulfobacterales bacterium HSG17]